jgi:monoamine oxidase
VAHDFCLAVGMFGVGFLICGIRLGIFARRDRKVAKAYLARCRAWGLKTEHFSRDSINNLTLVVGRRVTGRFGRRLTLAERDLIALRHDVEQLQTLAFAEHEAQLRADGATVLDEPSVIALRKEAADGAAC